MVNTVVIGTSLLDKYAEVVAYYRDTGRKILFQCQCVRSGILMFNKGDGLLLMVCRN